MREEKAFNKEKLDCFDQILLINSEPNQAETQSHITQSLLWIQTIGWAQLVLCNRFSLAPSSCKVITCLISTRQVAAALRCELLLLQRSV